MCAVASVCVCVCVRMHVLRIVSTDMILYFINTLIIITVLSSVSLLLGTVYCLVGTLTLSLARTLGGVLSSGASDIVIISILSLDRTLGCVLFSGASDIVIISILSLDRTLGCVSFSGATDIVIISILSLDRTLGCVSFSGATDIVIIGILLSLARTLKSPESECSCGSSR